LEFNAKEFAFDILSLSKFAEYEDVQLKHLENDFNC